MSLSSHSQLGQTSTLRSWSRLSAIPAAAALVAGMAVPTTAATAWAVPTNVAAAVPASPAGPGTITTFAGGGVGDGGRATNASLGGGFADETNPHGVAVDRSGAVYVASNRGPFNGYNVPDTNVTGYDRVRRIDPSTGLISTVAGGPTAGFSGDGGPATSSQLSVPNDMAFDSAGNMYVEDAGNQRVRRVDARTGIITTAAGSGDNLFGFSGDGGPATKARLALYQDFDSGNHTYGPSGIAVDGAGNLFIGDPGNGRVRRVDAATGIITTVAGSGFQTSCCPDLGGQGDGGPATLAALTGVQDVAVDPQGNLYIADYWSQSFVGSRIRRVDARTGIITTVAGGGALGDGGPATSAAINPGCVDFDSAGNMFICDYLHNGSVRRVDVHSGIITTVESSVFANDVTVDAAGNLYVSVSGGDEVDRVDASTGSMTRIAGGGIGDGGPASAAVLRHASGLATAGGTTYIADGGDAFSSPSLRKVDAAGNISTVCCGQSESAGLAADTAGDVFISSRGSRDVKEVNGATGSITTVAGGGSPSDGIGDGGPATSAALASPDGLFLVGPGNARWPAGTLFIADGPRVRMVAPSGIITTVAGGGSGLGDGGPATRAGLRTGDMAVDQTGNIYIADNLNQRIRRVDARNGIISTIAGIGMGGLHGVGGRAVNAELAPVTVLVDQGGNVYIGDRYKRVVKVDTAGNLQLVAGTGAPGLGGDGGPAIYGEFASVGHLAFDANGNLLVSDGGNDRVREVRLGVSNPPAGCGEVITASVTLTHDLGPCSGAGIFVGADNVTLNLNGHRVFGSGTAQDGQYAGIMIAGHSGVTVAGGRVDHFSAGLAIINGTNNTVQNMTLQDNVGSYDEFSWGDGIVLYYSSHSRIVNNTVTRSGVFDNIAVLGHRSDNNLLKGNTVTDSFGVDNGLQSGVGVNVSFNAFADPGLPDRGSSEIGNQIIGNTVLRGYANGITNRANAHAQIIGNTSNGNGVGDHDRGVGIGVLNLLNASPHFDDLVQGNTVMNNACFGIQAGGDGSRFIANTAIGNATSGRCSDLSDDGPPCPNFWSGNTYGSASPSCTTNAGHQVTPPAPAGTGLAPALSPQVASPNGTLRRPQIPTELRGRLGWGQ